VERRSRSLAIRGLSVSRGSRRVLDDVAFDANPGEICVIVGPNGAGKTTLLEASIGLLHADAGRVTLGDEPLSTFPRSARAFAYMPDEADLPAEATVRTILGSAGTRSDAVSNLGAKLAPAAAAACTVFVAPLVLFAVYVVAEVDGTKRLDKNLDAAPVSGRVGLWSKADSVVMFDDFEVSAL